MSYALPIYPTVDEALVGRIVRAYDPTVDVVRPHIPVVFPVPESIGLDWLATHIANALDDRPPIEIRFGDLVRSRGHWLFLVQGAVDDWEHPRPQDFDAARCVCAFHLAVW